MTEPCELNQLSFVGWLKWIEENRLVTRCYVIETVYRKYSTDNCAGQVIVT